MESQGANIVSVSALRLNTGGRSVIVLDIKRLSPALETGSASLTVLLTDTGTAGQGGDTAARLVVEDISLVIDTVTDLGMEGGNVEDKKKRASDVTLMDVLLTTTGTRYSAAGQGGDVADLSTK